MVDPRSSRSRISPVALVFLVVLAAVVGGVVARMLPFDSGDSAIRTLAAPSEASLAPLVRKTAPAVVNIATLQPSPAEQNRPSRSLLPPILRCA